MAKPLNRTIKKKNNGVGSSCSFKKTFSNSITLKYNIQNLLFIFNYLFNIKSSFNPTLQQISLFSFNNFNIVQMP